MRVWVPQRMRLERGDGVGPVLETLIFADSTAYVKVNICSGVGFQKSLRHQPNACQPSRHSAAVPTRALAASQTSIRALSGQISRF